jgi:hypothetical protein
MGGLPRPNCQTKLIAPRSVNAQRWDEWLTARGYPPQDKIEHRHLDTGQCEMPVASAPDKIQMVSHRIALAGLSS